MLGRFQMSARSLDRAGFSQLHLAASGCLCFGAVSPNGEDARVSPDKEHSARLNRGVSLSWRPREAPPPATRRRSWSDLAHGRGIRQSWIPGVLLGRSSYRTMLLRLICACPKMSRKSILRGLGGLFLVLEWVTCSSNSVAAQPWWAR